MTASHMWTAPSSQGYFGQCSDQIACVHMWTAPSSQGYFGQCSDQIACVHMWTAPSSQGYFGQCSDQIACVHMSGLFSRSHMNAGQDGFRDASSKHPSDLWR